MCSLSFRLLVEYTDPEHKSDFLGEWKEWKGYLFAGAMFVIAFIQSLAFGQFVYLMNTIGMRINTALIGLVYEKVIKMPGYYYYHYRYHYHYHCHYYEDQK